MSSIAEATRLLNAAGLTVTPADGVPGLFDVAGIARDVTSGQLIDLARLYGAGSGTVLIPFGGVAR